MEEVILPEVKAWDLFASSNPQSLGTAICAIERFWAPDGRAEFGHTGIVTNADGDTFEALWRIKRQNLFEAYAGQKVLIARWVGLPEHGIPGMTDELGQMAMMEIEKSYEGHRYPGWRLALHLVPPMAKYISYKGRFGVCSEITAKFLYNCHLALTDLGHFAMCPNGRYWPRHDRWLGTNPDRLADEWGRWQGYRIVHYGALPELT